MAKKKKLDFNEMDVVELKRQLAERRDKLFRLRLTHAAAPLRNHRQIRDTRKDVARVITALRQKEVAS